MKVKKEIFSLVAGRYVAGDVMNLFDEKDAKKIKTALTRLKATGGYNKKLDLYFFKANKTNNIFTDYIDNKTELAAESCLVIVPEDSIKSGRLSGCRRFIAKHTYQLKYVEDKLGTALYFNYPNEPGPFMMLVNELDS